MNFIAPSHEKSSRRVDYGVPPPFVPLLSQARLLHFEKGQIILYEDDSPTDLYVIKEGVIKVHDIDAQGNDKILHILKPPAIFPMEFPLGITKKIHSFYTPITDTEVYALSQDYVNEQLAENIEFASYLAHYYAHEAHELLLRISSMEKTNSYDKLKAALKFLAVHHAEARHSGWRRVRFPINHQLLADMIGITRESTTLVMKKFHQNKLIRSPRPTILEINFKKLITF